MEILNCCERTIILVVASVQSRVLRIPKGFDLPRLDCDELVRRGSGSYGCAVRRGGGERSEAGAVRQEFQQYVQQNYSRRFMVTMILDYISILKKG